MKLMAMVTGNGSLILICSLSNRSLLPSLTVQKCGGDGFNQFLLDTYILFLDVQNKKVTNGGST